MTQRTQLLASVVTLVIAFVAQTGSATAADATPGYRIMSEKEADSYRMAMQALNGQAREDYRNMQYEKLRERALENGFRMPVTPPWAGQTGVNTEAAAPPATTAPAAAGEAAAQAAKEAAERHAAMREKLHSGRESLQQAAAADSARLQAEARQTQAASPAQAPQESDVPTAPATLRNAPPATTGDPSSPPEALAAPAPAVVPSVPTSTPVFAPPTPPAAEPEAPVTSAAERVPPPPVAPVPEPVPAPLTEPVLPTPSVLAADSAVTTEAPAMAAPLLAPEATADVAAPPPQPAMSNVDAYRESMRLRFDEYMKERQAKHDEAMRLQREQREAALEQSRAQINRNRFQPPFPHPPGPVYGPRYPGAFPGYGTPYWQQPPPPPRSER